MMHVRWYLHQHITDIEETDKGVELLSRHVKVLFQAFQPCRTFQISAIPSANLRTITIRNITSVYLWASISLPVKEKTTDLHSLLSAEEQKKQPSNPTFAEAFSQVHARAER